MLGRVLFYGFRASLLMWCLAFIGHAPFLHVPSQINGLVLLAALAGSFLKLGVDLPRTRVPLAGALAGLVSGLVNILILGAQIVEQPATTDALKAGSQGIRSDAMVHIAGFLAASMVLGALSASIGSRLFQRPELAAKAPGISGHPEFLPRWARLMMIALFPLIVLGGWVTSADAGMSVEGWPGSGGASMILFPLSLMTDGRVFLEHSHRLFGMLVGLITLIGMVWMLIAERRGWIKALAITIFVLVCVQGVLGGKRVTLDVRVLGMVHGILAQIIFALAMVLAATQSSAFMFGGPARAHRWAGSARTLSIITLAAFFIQLSFGAAYRHLGFAADGTPKPGGIHSLYSHAGFAIVVAVLAAITGSRLRGIAGEVMGEMGRKAMRVGAALTHGVLAQFMLGWITFAVLMTSSTKGVVADHDELHAVPIVPIHEQLLATAHQGLGALLIGFAALAVLWSWRLVRKADPAGVSSGSSEDLTAQPPTSA
jgi:heme A synthase